MNCDWCDNPFSPARDWQRFCSPKCRNDWNNREKVRRQIEAAEHAREDRLNGLAKAPTCSEKKIDLAALGLERPSPVVRMRRLVAND
jgi:hypothetical protein